MWTQRISVSQDPVISRAQLVNTWPTAAVTLRGTGPGPGKALLSEFMAQQGWQRPEAWATLLSGWEVRPQQLTPEPQTCVFKLACKADAVHPKGQPKPSTAQETWSWPQAGVWVRTAFKACLRLPPSV